MKTKLQVKLNSNLTNLCAMHFNNIQCTIIKKGIISVVYVEDKKRSEPVKHDDDDDDDDDDDELFLWHG